MVRHVLGRGCAESVSRNLKCWMKRSLRFNTQPSAHVCAGTDEGGFAWLTLNYLLGHLGQSNSNTVAAIDLVGALGLQDGALAHERHMLAIIRRHTSLAAQGGGSVQMAYAMSAKEAGRAPDGYISNLSGGGQQYHVYVHRWGWHVYGGVRWI